MALVTMLSVLNTFNAIFVAPTEMDVNILWEETEAVFVLDDLDLWIYSTISLVNDVVIKFKDDSEMILQYSQSQIINHDGPGVYFTAYRDDSLKGDANGDGNLSSPTVGDWVGIYDEGTRHIQSPVNDGLYFYYFLI